MPLNKPLEGANELCRMDVAGLAAAYRDRSLSPVEVAQAVIDRAEEVNPEYNAFTYIDHSGALAAANSAEKRWKEGVPLSEVDGIPTTLKDIVWAKGWMTRYGSTATSAHPYKEDAPSVAMLRKAGAVFIAQTTTPEFGWKAVTDSPLFGITRNPWDKTKTPGGSSGGAAVAAAVGAGVFHLGTDGGGSIRIPASFTGIVGHKPTFGRVPAYPPSAFGTVAHIGPMARGVADAAAMLNAMSGRDLRDWAQGALKLAPLQDKALANLSGKRIGYWSKPATGNVDPEVSGLVDAAVEKLSAAGAVVEPIDLPAGNLLDLFHHHWFTGAAARLSSTPELDRKTIDPGLLEIARIGAAYSATDLVLAQIRRGEYGAAMDLLLTEYDFIVSPGTAVAAFDAGIEFPADEAFGRWTEWAGFNFPINLSQQPACVIPCGYTKAGLPVGFQIIGARGDDVGVLSAAAGLEVIFSQSQHEGKTQ